MVVEMNEKVEKSVKVVEKMVMEQDYDGARQRLLEMKSVFPSMFDQIESLSLYPSHIPLSINPRPCLILSFFYLYHPLSTNKI